MICKPIAAQFMVDDIIALFEFEWSNDQLAVAEEKHYRLVPPDQMSSEDLAIYRQRLG